MNYIGSKKTLLPFLQESIYQITGKNNNLTFLDLFAGTGVVGEHFKKLGHPVIANDIQYYSYVLNYNLIVNSRPLTFEKLLPIITKRNIKTTSKAEFVCNYLQELKGYEGFIYKNYSPTGTKSKNFQRLYFSDENTQKIDTIRTAIESWKKQELISNGEYFFLLATLLKNADKVANTASVYGAFLKKIKPSAKKSLQMIPYFFSTNQKKNKVFNQKIENLIPKIHGDILYLDPPYNSRQYATNYHLLETIAKYDSPKIYGKTGLRNYQNQKSKFCSKNFVLKSFQNIIKNARVKTIFVSYNNEGLMSFQEIKKIMSSRGKYFLFQKKYKTYKADSNRKNKSNFVIEYLHGVKIER